MTTNKRFKNVEENLEWGTVQYFTYHDEKITDKEIEKLVNHLLNQNDELNDENKQLKQELFESEKEWYECHYADNPVRLDSKLVALKEEFKERFGRDFE